VHIMARVRLSSDSTVFSGFSRIDSPLGSCTMYLVISGGMSPAGRWLQLYTKITTTTRRAVKRPVHRWLCPHRSRASSNARTSARFPLCCVALTKPVT
jgi:hypothetical protein